MTKREEALQSEFGSSAKIQPENTGASSTKIAASPLKKAFAERLKDLGIASLGVLMWVTAAGAQDNTLVPSNQQNPYVLNTNYSDTLNGTYANVNLELGKHLILTVGALKGAEESGPYGPYAGFTFNTVESSQDFFMKGGFEISMFNYQNEIAQQNSSNLFVGSANYAVAKLFPLTKTVDITVGGAASVSGSYTNSGNDISENWRFFSPPTLAGKILLGWNISPDKRVTLGLDTTAYNEFTNVQSYSMAFFPYSKLRLGYSTICLLGVPTNFGASYGEGPGYGRIFSIDTKGSPTPGTDVAVEYQQADKPTYVIFPEGRKIGLTVDKQLTSREGGPRFSLTASVEKLIYEWGGHSQTNSTVGFKLIIPFQPTRNLGAGMSVEKEVGTPFVANNYKIIPFESPAAFSFDELKQALETMSPDEFVNNFLRNRTKVKNLNDLLQSVAYITDQLGTYNWSEKSDPLFKGVNMLNITDAQMLSTLGESLRTGEPIPAVVCAGIFSAGSDWINAARLPGVFAFQASVEAGHPQGGHIITVVVTPKTIYLVDYFQYKIIDTGTRNSAEALALYERIQQGGDAALTHEIFYNRKFIGFAGGPFDDNYGSRDGELLRDALTIDGGKSADKLLEDAVKAVQPPLTVPQQPKAIEPLKPNINHAPIPEVHMVAKSASSTMLDLANLGKEIADKLINSKYKSDIREILRKGNIISWGKSLKEIADELGIVIPDGTDWEKLSEKIWQNAILRPQEVVSRAREELGKQQRLFNSREQQELFALYPVNFNAPLGTVQDKALLNTAYAGLLSIDEARRIGYSAGAIKQLDVSKQSELDKYVEAPAQRLVKDIIGLGGITYSSNAYGDGLKGVFWIKNNTEYFTPLTIDDYNIDDITRESLGLIKSSGSPLDAKGGIDLSKIELTLKDEKYISSLSPADVKVLRAAKALKDGWNSLSLLYAHEVMLMLEDKVVLSLKNKPMLQEVLNQLNSKECLDPQGLIFLQAMQSRLSTLELAAVKP